VGRSVDDLVASIPSRGGGICAEERSGQYFV
jgi:hypothetical protein